MSQISVPQLNWRAAGTTSDRISLAGITVCGFFLPSTFVGTSVSFMVCDSSDGTYVTLKDETGAPVMSEKMVEIQFQGGKPVRVGDQFGLGRVGAPSSK